MADTLSSIADAEKAAAESLVLSLRNQGLADTATLEAFAAEYAAPAARWGIELVQAKLAGDAEAIQQKTDDFLDLAALAAAKAGDMLILGQGTSEQAGKDTISSALSMAMKVAVSSLIAL